MLEIYHNATNRKTFEQVSAQFGIQNPGIPMLLIENKALIGDVEIKQHLEESVLDVKERIDAGYAIAPATMNPVPGSTPVTVPLVIFSAMIDSINPCGFAVLIFLLVSLAVAGDSRRILLIGGTYITALFVFHLLVGIGVFSALSFSDFSKGFSLLGAAVALVLGVITLGDVIRNRDTYLLSIPESKKGIIRTYFLKASVPAAFVLGILAGLFGFACTGGIYISILGLMGRNFIVMDGLPYLVLYNIIFVLPLILVTLMVAYGLPPERVDHWRTENRRGLRIIVGAAMVILGVIIFLGWFG